MGGFFTCWFSVDVWATLPWDWDWFPFANALVLNGSHIVVACSDYEVLHAFLGFVGYYWFYMAWYILHYLHTFHLLGCFELPVPARLRCWEGAIPSTWPHVQCWDDPTTLVSRTGRAQKYDDMDGRDSRDSGDSQIQVGEAKRSFSVSACFKNWFYRKCFS